MHGRASDVAEFDGGVVVGASAVDPVGSRGTAGACLAAGDRSLDVPPFTGDPLGDHRLRSPALRRRSRGIARVRRRAGV